MSKNKTISGTDIAAIVGQSPYKTKLDVWLEKQGLAEPKVQTEAMIWGLKMEPLLAERYTEETGRELTTFTPPKMQHPAISWWVGSPDRRAKKEPLIIELKTAGERQAWRWGERPDEVPPEYLLQTLWYLPMIDAEGADIAVLIGNREFRVYHINRDRELEAMLQEEAERFLKDHVLAGIVPALDGSKSATNYLKRKYPADSGPMLEPTDQEILADIDRYRENREQQKHVEALVSLYENRLKDFVGSCSGIQGDFGRITWKRSRDSQSVDWKGLAMSLNPNPDQMNNFTTIKPGSRRWLPKFNKED